MRIPIGLLLGLGVACSGGASEPSAATASPDAGGSPPGQTIDSGTTPPADAAPIDTDSGTSVSDALAARVIGHYAIKSVIASIQDAPVIGKTPSVATAIGLGEIKRAGNGLTITEQGCRVELSESSVAKPSVPDAVPRSVPPVTYPLRLWQDGPTVKFVRDAVATAIGVKLANPESDPLPTSANDARVWDQDGDGNPGVTVKMSGTIVNGDIFVVQRQKSIYSGELGAGDKLSGLVRDMSQQSTIGATNELLKQAVPTTPDPDPSKSTVRFAKLSSAYDCARLVSEASTLFPK
jgi:hypothetical protein